MFKCAKDIRSLVPSTLAYEQSVVLERLLNIVTFFSLSNIIRSVQSDQAILQKFHCYCWFFIIQIDIFVKENAYCIVGLISALLTKSDPQKKTLFDIVTCAEISLSDLSIHTVYMYIIFDKYGQVTVNHNQWMPLQSGRYSWKNNISDFFWSVDQIPYFN